MTALELLTYIIAALLLQVVAGIAIGLWRRGVPSAATPPTETEEGGSGAWPGWREFRVVRRAFEDAAQSQCSFYLQPVDGLPLASFQPGQYLTFSLKVPNGDGGLRTLTRCYSLSDRPDPPSYRVTVKRMPAPADHPEWPAGVASNHFHDHVHAGDVLQVKAPAGHFTIAPDANVPAVFIAGGIGITPMLSMLRWCLAEQPERRVHLFYGVRNSEDHAFKELLQDLAAAHPSFQLNVVYASPAAADVLARDFQQIGYIDLALLRRTLPHGRHQFYVCGPPPMMQSLVQALRDWGVPSADIHFEAFGPATVRPAGPITNEPAANQSAGMTVRFSRSGRTLVWDGLDGNLLDFAERHDLSVDSGCRSGSCGACQTRVLSGEVRYADTPDHEVARGHCLMCVGRPQSALVLDA